MQKQKKFQIDVEDPYSLRSELQFPGLVVLEIFAHWCDVCKSIDPIFRNHFVDLATRKLKFVRVQHAFVPWLRRYHGRCRPTFLFFVGGALKEIVNGINTPKLDMLIPQLAPEDDVPLEKFVPEEHFPELNTDDAYLQYAARVEELERNHAIAIEAGTDSEIDPRGEYNSLIKEFEKVFQLPMSAYSPKQYTTIEAPKLSAENDIKLTKLEKDEILMQQTVDEQKLVALSDAAETEIVATNDAPETLVELDDKPYVQSKETGEAPDTAAADATEEGERNRPLSDVSEERMHTPASPNSTEDDQGESMERGEDRSMLDDLDLETRRNSEHPDQEPLEDGQEKSEGAFHYEADANVDDGRDEQEAHDGHHSDDHPGFSEEILEGAQPDVEQGHSAANDNTDHEDAKEDVILEQDVAQEPDNVSEEAPEEPEEPVRNVESAGTNGTTDILDFAYTPEHVDGDIVDLLETEEYNQLKYIDQADQEL